MPTNTKRKQTGKIVALPNRADHEHTEYPFKIIRGNCKDILPTLPAMSFDSIVCDPPYELGFMGRSWDESGIAYDQEMWGYALRALKPGGHLLAFSATRTYHRMACAIEDAGFIIRDQLGWLYSSGFPKARDMSKMIDSNLGYERKRTDTYFLDDEPVGDEGKEWYGFAACLKPAWEPVVMACRPFDGPIQKNIQKHGVGALNIDKCRVGDSGGASKTSLTSYQDLEKGRWPANLFHDGSEDVLKIFPNDSARCFYSGKATKTDRDEGLEGHLEETPNESIFNQKTLRNEKVSMYRNHHPTVKPTSVMQWLVRLVTPPGGHVLDPFTGSGSTGKACGLEGFKFTGIELSEKFIQIATLRTLFGYQNRKES